MKMQSFLATVVRESVSQSSFLKEMEGKIGSHQSEELRRTKNGVEATKEQEEDGS